MTSPDLNGFSPAAPDTDRLSAAWNDLVSGRPLSVTPHEGGLVEVIQGLHAAERPLAARPTFKHDLKERIMSTPMPRSMPHVLLIQPQPHAFPASTKVASTAVAPTARRITRWTAIAATIALLLATAFSAYLSGFDLPHDRRLPTNVAAPLSGSPETGSSPVSDFVDPCSALGPYVPCGPDRMVASALIARDGLPVADFGVSLVQMQSWHIAPGMTATYKQQVDPVAGVGIDIVLTGAYVVTFSGTAIVARTNPVGVMFLYKQAGEVIELGAGDAITYDLGTKVEVRNAFTVEALTFKSILFYKGTSFPDSLAEGPPAEDDFRMTVDGDGTLPKPLDQYPNEEVSITLNYVQLLPEYPFPPDIEYRTVVLGPVDPLDGLEWSEGYVVWAIQPMG